MPDLQPACHWHARRLLSPWVASALLDQQPLETDVLQDALETCAAPADHMPPSPSARPAAPFGTVLGVTHGGVEVFSCDYDSITDLALLQDRASFQTSWQGTMTGFKYQCVELARRYLLVNH